MYINDKLRRQAYAGTLKYVTFSPLWTNILQPTDFVSYLRNPFIRGFTIFGACKASQ